jgi:hypothetical protein
MINKSLSSTIFSNFQSLTNINNRYTCIFHFKKNSYLWKLELKQKICEETIFNHETMKRPKAYICIIIPLKSWHISDSNNVFQAEILELFFSKAEIVIMLSVKTMGPNCDLLD